MLQMCSRVASFYLLTTPFHALDHVYQPGLQINPRPYVLLVFLSQCRARNDARGKW